MNNTIRVFKKLYQIFDRDFLLMVIVTATQGYPVQQLHWFYINNYIFGQWQLSFTLTIKCSMTIKGAGGGLDLAKGEIEFDAVSDREKCKLSDAFFGIKKYCS